MTLAALAEAIVAIERPHSTLVAIDGGSAFGKTTLADELAALVDEHGRPVIRATIDNCHRPRAERYARGILSGVFFYEDTFNYPRLREVLLEPLQKGFPYLEAISAAGSDLPIQPTWRLAPARAVLLFDGVWLLRPELNDVWDFRVLLDVDIEVAARRGIERDQAWMPSREYAEERYQRRYTPADLLYIERVRPREQADVVVENTDPANRRFVLRSHRKRS